MGKKLILAVGIFVVVLLVVFLIRTNTDQSENYNQNINNNNNEPLILGDNTKVETTPSEENNNENDEEENEDSDSNEETMQESSGITLAELSNHNSETDCWVVYDDKVYDVTDYLPRHPGGKNKISRNCGTLNFEEDFTNKHGTSKVNLLMNVGVFIGDFDVIGELEN